MKKQDKKTAESAETAGKAKKKPFPVTRARALRRLGRQKGLLKGKVNSPLLEWIGRSLGLERRLAAAYIALFAEALDHNGMAIVDAVAETHKLGAEARLGLVAAAEKLVEAGLAVPRKGGSPSVLHGPTLHLDAVAFLNVLHKRNEEEIDYSDPLAVVGEAEKLLPLVSRREVSQRAFFARLARLAERSEGQNILGTWLKGAPPVELALFFTAAAMAANYGRPCDVDELLHDCQLSMAEKGEALRLLGSGRALLSRRRLVRFGKSPISDCLSFSLSKRATSKLFPKLRNPGAADDEEKGKVTGLLPCPDRRRELFLPPALAGDLAALERACSAVGFGRFQARVSKSGLPPGLTVLLHGAPGTGKTVAALNLAHAGGRPVLQVDMSQVRDKYVGESEKNVSAVFRRWREYRKKDGPAPLLLLNEADALVGRRVAVGHSVDQMHNIMQNVLLEELERFDGILVATTNLLDNIDAAFDRRFLFKLRFDPPGPVERLEHLAQPHARAAGRLGRVAVRPPPHRRPDRERRPPGGAGMGAGQTAQAGRAGGHGRCRGLVPRRQAGSMSTASRRGSAAGRRHDPRDRGNGI